MTEWSQIAIDDMKLRLKRRDEALEMLRREMDASA